MTVQHQDGLVALVQLPHPGGEHRPPTDVMGWNTGPHRRKFLLNPGDWIDGTGASGHGPVCFWGEWEPPSRVVARHRPPATTALPQVLHEPRRGPTTSGWRQNTDPLVFGGFSYTNCRQARSRKLRNLPPGSVILFGSKLDHHFVLDTCLVVAAGVDYTAAHLPARTGRLERECVFDPLFSDPRWATTTFHRYNGATTDQPIGPMFSFVPAQHDDTLRWGFPRPLVPLGPDLINPHLTQAAKVTLLDFDQATDSWRRIVDAVLDTGLLLATRLDPPKRPRRTQPTRPTPTPVSRGRVRVSPVLPVYGEPD